MKINILIIVEKICPRQRQQPMPKIYLTSLFAINIFEKHKLNFSNLFYLISKYKKFTNMITQKQLNKIISTIVKEFQPEKIILFGSYAIGSPTEESDLDLLIIKDTHLPTLELNREIRRCISSFGVPIDVMVKSNREFEQYKNIIGTIIYPANKFGKVIYESRRSNKRISEKMDEKG